MGGFHATLVPDEVMEHADSVVIGGAEKSWPRLLNDFQNNRMRRFYRERIQPDLAGIFPDRSIYAGKKYARISLVETGRGCPFACEFCSITAFFGRTVHSRPVEDVVAELRSLDNRNVVFFIDDNIAADVPRAHELFSSMVPLKIRWVGQVSIHAARDEGLIRRMKQSGCLGVLIGFESLDPSNLAVMGKTVNNAARDYEDCLSVFRRHRMIIYGTFMFGYDNDTADLFARTYRLVQRNRFFFAAFNHLVPFPGTPLYARLQKENRLLYDRWWLEPGYRFGDLAFRPGTISADRLAALCLVYRRRMYSLPSIIRRGLDFRCNCRNPFLALAFFSLNWLSGIDVDRRQGLPLGA